VQTLLLLSKDKLSDNLLSQLWRAHFVDRKVRAAIHALFGVTPDSGPRDPDSGLIRLLRKRTQLRPSEIRSSIQRAEDIIVRFPVLPTLTSGESEPAEATEATPPAPSRSLRGIKVSDIVAFGLAKPGDRWRALKERGVWAYAEVLPGGSLLVDGRQYASPSAAGRAVTGWSSFDGWRHWRFEDDSGEWRSVSELRQRVAGAKPDHSAAPSGEQGGGGGSFAPSDRLEGKPEAQAVYEELVQRTKEAVGEFSVHANSKHIVFSNRTAFAVINVHKRDLRVGLRLHASEADSHRRLKAQPKGIFEGWSALHVSTSVPRDGGIDDELLSLIAQAHREAG
jgi:hypothetical protein